MNSSPRRAGEFGRGPIRLSDAVRAALSGNRAECPSVERVHGAVAGHGTAAERSVVLEHAKSCAVCAAEMKLAEEFERTHSAAESAAIDGVLAGVTRPYEGPAGRPAVARRTGAASPPDRHKIRRVASWAFAAAAALLLAVTLYSQFAGSRPSPFDPGNSGGGVRSVEIQLLAPLGEVPPGTLELRWSAVPGATSYRVEIYSADGRKVEERTLTETRLQITASESGPILPSSVYSWHVQAEDASGKVVGNSETRKFSVSSR
jgi:hypothetical protein